MESKVGETICAHGENPFTCVVCQPSPQPLLSEEGEEERLARCKYECTTGIDSVVCSCSNCFLRLAALWGLKRGRELGHQDRDNDFAQGVWRKRRAAYEAEITRRKAEVENWKKVNSVLASQNVENRASFDLTLAKQAETIAALRKALEFYAGHTREAEWVGAALHAFDKFGGLCADLSGPYVAREALNLGAGEW